jgi:hypothetical protein
MFGTTFYHEHLRKYVVLFGTLFNDIYINRANSSGQILSSMKVPISYSPKEKMIVRVDQDPNFERPVAIVLPRMGFEMTTMAYASERKLSSIKKFGVRQDNNNDENLKYIYNPVPYDIGFSLYIAVKNTEDGTRILEQILPFFTPEWTATVNLIPDLNIKTDIPTILTSVTSQDIYDGDYTSRRALVWTLEFTMKGYIFGPVKESGVITLANTNFYEDVS